MSSNYNSQEDDIFEQLGLPAITVPKLLRSPLPLQCLAAEALSDEWKQEIEQLTDSSIKELKKGSPVPSIGSCKVSIIAEAAVATAILRINDAWTACMSHSAILHLAVQSSL